MPIIGPATGFAAGELAARILTAAWPDAPDLLVRSTKFLVHTFVGEAVAISLAAPTAGLTTLDMGTTPLSATLHAMLPDDVASDVFNGIMDMLGLGSDPAVQRTITSGLHDPNGPFGGFGTAPAS